MAIFDTNLQCFVRELPEAIGKAGKNAGRQAVHGLAESAMRVSIGSRSNLRELPLGTWLLLDSVNTPLNATNQQV